MVRILVDLSLDSFEAVEDKWDAQADLSLRWSHKYCRFCRGLLIFFYLLAFRHGFLKQSFVCSCLLVHCLHVVYRYFQVLSYFHLKPSLSKHDMPCLSKQCRSRSVGFFRSQLIWICTVCHSVHEFISSIWIKESGWLTITTGRGILIYSAGQWLTC